ncbi:MAG: single-stranded-DNA-specific exonuclease RecJ [Smithellaceae bacterium]|nr:single-stranded-DNA-specific exonuclease RecJ [Smithellaceae bacterium]
MVKTVLPVTQWKLSAHRKDLEDNLIRELGLRRILSQILVNRDIVDPDDARRYLLPSLNDLHNPFLMKDMITGVDRLIEAIRRNDQIVIYGDYDADGITSVVLLLKFLKEISASVEYYIPDRIEEGYGLNRSAIDRMKAAGVNLIITVDCGVSDIDEISHAKSLGIDTIVLDHHEVPDTLPPAVASINPNRRDCPFPFKHLAAVGIVFNFLIALRGQLRREGFWVDRPYPNLREYLDLVALGTIGDISPLIDENRVLTKIGLELITEEKRVGIKALKEICALESQTIDSAKASYALIPRINAAGRIASPQDAVELLMTDELGQARDLARKLDGHNKKRQTLEKDILNEIIGGIEAGREITETNSFVFASPHWHPGVIGIVAARLVDRYCRPAILISLKNGVGKGSGRSIPDFNIYDGLKKCDSLLLSYGGHRFAAGISIRETDVDAFRRLLSSVVGENLTPSDFAQHTNIDAQCELNEINIDLIDQIKALAPFGCMNPEPVFCTRNLSIVSTSVVGNNHLRIRVNGNGSSCSSIWFNMGHHMETLTGANIDLVFTPHINNWNGLSDIQLKTRDIAIRA